ncbi:MAG TPA: gluconokinase [Puia sp.]|nr:gluconokinase [Puia sp.]
MNYYLGVDIGTTSVKAVAFSATGEVIERQQTHYPMQHPAPDRSELDPDEVVRAVSGCINKVIAAAQPASLAMVSFSSAMHSFLAVDAAGRPLTSCMIWADNRAAKIAEQLVATEQGAAFYRASGVPVHAMTPLCKLVWLRQQEPEIFRGASRFVGIKEYVFQRLFGETVVDTAIASATGLLNIRSLQWDEEILNYLSIDASRLSRLVSPTYIIHYDAGKTDASLALSLPPGVPVVTGASDGALANLSTGATGPHTMSVTIGTSGAARMVIEGAETDEHMRTFCYHVYNNYYIVGGATNNGAVVLQWLKEEVLQTEEDFTQLLSLASGVAAGSEELLFIPYILGERAPVWNSAARGIYFGLDIGHTKAHFIRAAMEGVVYSVYSIGKVLMEKKKPRELHASGGFVRSQLWLQILADVFNIKVLVFGDDESSALGAVVIGMEALGKPRTSLRKALAVYKPDASNHAVYMRRFEKFGRIYQLVKNEFNNN